MPGIMRVLPIIIKMICKLCRPYFEMVAESGYPLLSFEPSRIQIKGETVAPRSSKAVKTFGSKTAPDPQNTYSCM